MGIEPFLITSTLQAVLAQRLVRRLCPSCQRPREVSAAEAADLGAAPGTSLRAWQAGGCAECRQSGVHGRTGLYELMVFSDPIRRAVLERVPLAELRRIAQAEGMVSLRQDGVQKIQEGVTTVEEVLRETQG
jgi:general secretion pathway protein E